VLANDTLGLHFDPTGPAGSSDECNAATDSGCKVIGPGEGADPGNRNKCNVDSGPSRVGILEGPPTDVGAQAREMKKGRSLSMGDAPSFVRFIERVIDRCLDPPARLGSGGAESLLH